MGFEGLFFGVVEGGEEIESGAALDFGGGDGEMIEGFEEGRLVGEDGGEDDFGCAVEGEDDFEGVGGDGDLVAADGLDFGGIEDGAGDDVDGIGVGGEAADGVFELTPAASVDGLILGDGVGEEEGGAEGIGGPGEVGGGDHVGAGEAGEFVVGIGGGGLGELCVLAEVRRSGE